MSERETVTSRQNKAVVLVSKLDEKKYRDAEGMFRFDGIKLFSEACFCGLENQLVFIKESSADKIIARLYELGIEDLEAHTKRCIYINDEIFNKISSEKSPEGIICASNYIDKFHKIIKINKRGIFYDGENEPQIYRGEKLIMLESIRDPGNLGTIIRGAYALGIDRILLSGDCADIYNSKTVRAAMGSLFRMKIDRLHRDCALSDAINALRSSGRRVFATALDKNALPFENVDLRSDDVVVIGNEGHGISPESINACDRSVYIPMTEGAESLNAAMAATVFIWELGKCKQPFHSCSEQIV